MTRSNGGGGVHVNLFVMFFYQRGLSADLIWRPQYSRVVLNSETPSGVVVRGSSPPGGPVDKAQSRCCDWVVKDLARRGGKTEEMDSANEPPKPSAFRCGARAPAKLFTG